MQGAVGAAKGSPRRDFFELPGQTVWLSRCLLAMNVRVSVRIWSDTCFYYNTLPDSEIVGENYCPHLLLIIEGYSYPAKKPKNL